MLQIEISQQLTPRNFVQTFIMFITCEKGSKYIVYIQPQRPASVTLTTT